MTTEVVGVAVGFILSLALTALVKPVAVRFGAVALPKADRWHRAKVPLLGGVAIAGAVVGGALVNGVRDADIWELLAGALTLSVVGLVDDVRPLRPQTKFVAQILVAAALAALGLQLRLTGYPVLDILVTVVWIVGITNAINLLDNMDGLAAGVAAIAVGFRLAFFVLDGNAAEAAFAAIVLGATLGFLVHNFNPASIFMGDAGSLFLGVLVSGLNLVGGWPYSKAALSVLLFPVLILLVPIFDTLFVSVVRTMAGRSLSTGGRDHTSHRLVMLGLSEREAVLVLHFVALLSGSVAYMAYIYGISYTVVLIAFLAIGLGLLGVYLARLKVYPEEEAHLTEGTRFFGLAADFSYKRQVAAVAIDAALIVLAYYSAYLLRFEDRFHAEQPLLIRSLPLVLACQLAALAGFRIYQGVWRYTGVRDLVKLTKAATVGSLASVLAVVLLFRFEGFSRAVFILDWLLLVVLVGGSRIFFKTIEETLQPRREGERVLIYGAGDGGVMLLRELLNNRALGRQVVGFVDDDRAKHRTTIRGMPVLGGLDSLEEAIRSQQVTQVILSSPKITPERALAIGRICHSLDVPVVRATLRIE